jgi:hypothetical protein
MTAPTTITARGIRQRLTRAGIDPERLLLITDHPTRGRVLDFDYASPWQEYNEVRISGPREVRHQASSYLLDVGLSLAPYSDRDSYYPARAGSGRGE